MPLKVAIILGLIVAIVAIVVLYLKVLPSEVDGKLNNKFLQFLHDYFHFKKLYIESVLRFLFAFATVLTVSFGFFLLISFETTFWGDTQSYFLPGLLLIVLGPIVLRVTYELLMMVILLVQSVISINDKLKKQNNCVEAAVTVSKEDCSDGQLFE